MDYDSNFDHRSICLDTIETLPDDLKPRVATWFENRRAEDTFNWRDFIEHFRVTFADHQGRQTVSEFLNQMEQGENLYFAEFVQDFEHRWAQSGVEEAYTSLGKTQQLKAFLRKTPAGINWTQATRSSKV